MIWEESKKTGRGRYLYTHDLALTGTATVRVSIIRVIFYISQRLAWSSQLWYASTSVPHSTVVALYYTRIKIPEP